MCDWRECGGLLLAHHPHQVPALRQAACEWVEAGQPVRVLAAPDLRTEIGSDAFAAGLLMERTAAVQPAKLHAAARRGGRAPRAPRCATAREPTPPRARGQGFLVQTAARRHRRGRRPRGCERVRRRRAPGPRAARAAGGELRHRHRAPRTRAGAVGDAGRPDVLRHQAPPELLAPVTRPADGVRRPRVARGDDRRRQPRRALRRDGARAPAAAGDHGHARAGAAAWRSRSIGSRMPAGSTASRTPPGATAPASRWPRGSGSAPRPG